VEQYVRRLLVNFQAYQTVRLKVMLGSIKLANRWFYTKNLSFLFRPCIDHINFFSRSSRIFFISKYIYIPFLLFISFINLFKFNSNVIDFFTRVYTNTSSYSSFLSFISYFHYNSLKLFSHSQNIFILNFSNSSIHRNSLLISSILWILNKNS
jgi:hypothetical protein